MTTQNTTLLKYGLAVLLGAIGGGIIVALVTRAAPKMMAGMMHNMKSCMQEMGCECSPEMCQKMMKE
jgi:hypothetical protein